MPTLYPTQTTHLNTNRFLTKTEVTYPAAPASRFDGLRSISQRTDIQIDQVQAAYPIPHSLCSTREPTSDSTKTKQPTLDPFHLIYSTAGPQIDPRIDQDRAAYPAPSSTQPCQTSTESNSTKSNSTTLHRPSGDDTSKIPQPLQVSRNPENPLGKSRRRTAYPQQIVTTRLLYCLQDRFAQLSRLQRI